MNNDALIAELNRWARNDAQIEPSAWKCSYYGDCKASLDGFLDPGTGCQMSYIGRRYRSDTIDESFSLMLVGIDHGEKGGADYSECRQGIEDWYQIGGTKFNPDYKGVVKIASNIFGRAGQYCSGNCSKTCRKSTDPDFAQCVIDRICRANSVKCTPSNTTSRKSRATWNMKQNCAHHLLDEIRIVKPDLIVFQGVDARFVVRPEFAACGLDLKAVGGICDRHGPVIYESKALGTRLLFLYHSAYGHLDRQWKSVVVPALDYLRDQNVIPL
jgi:hypothetical protein